MLMEGKSGACQENPTLLAAGRQCPEMALMAAPVSSAAQVSLFADVESDQDPVSPSLPDWTSR